MQDLTIERAQSIVQTAAPGHVLVSVKPAFGSFTNDVRVLDCRTSEGQVRQLVVKFMVDQPEYSDRNAAAHYYSLKLAREHEMPVPDPIYMDKTGEILGAPGLVMGFMPGSQVANPVDAEAWARAQAQMLLRIHSIRPSQDYRNKLFDGNLQTLYFLDGDLPVKMSGHPLSNEIFNAVRKLRSSLVSVDPVLVHLDYWHGNVLWEHDKISAIVDWDFAGYGDPAIYVAYFRMNMYLRGIKEVAGVFLEEYEIGAGQAVMNLGFRELAAAAQPLPDPSSQVFMNEVMGGRHASHEAAEADFRKFVQGALERAYAGR